MASRYHSCAFIPVGLMCTALRAEDLGDVNEAWSRREFLKRHGQPASPIRVLVRGGGNVYRISLVRQIVDLRHRENGRRAGEESVRRPRQRRDIRVAIGGQQSLVAERPEELRPVTLSSLPL